MFIINLYLKCIVLEGSFLLLILVLVSVSCSVCSCLLFVELLFCLSNTEVPCRKSFITTFHHRKEESPPVAWWLKRLPEMQDTWVRSLDWEDPLEKEMATHSSILAWRIPWREEPGRIQSTGSQKVGND